MSSCPRPIRGGGGADAAEKDVIVDTECQETILGTSVVERMCVTKPRLVSADSSPLVAPHALWGSDALDLTYDPVRSHAGQAVRRQKRLYDQ